MSEPNLNSPATLVGDREIHATRVFDAPRDLVFQMWTDPKHLPRWWGPNGFNITTFHHELKPGGVWRFVMHGPDGTDYENKVTYLEIARPERLVYKHGGDKDVGPVNFQVTVTFTEIGAKTKVHMRMQFPNPDARDFVIKTYGAMEGANQHIGRLEELLAHRNEPPKEFVISRTFDAPRELVWKAWTEREGLMQWFGPKGFTMTTANLDFRVGGTFHYGLKAPDGTEVWGKFTYREIVAPGRLVWVNSFSNAAGGLGRHPFAPEWPQQMLTLLTLAEHEGKTTVTIHWSALDVTPAEQKTFDEGHPSMTMGWTGTFEQLTDYLKHANA